MTDRTIIEKSSALGRLAAQRLQILQQGYLAQRMTAVAAHAALRRAVTAPVGASPDIWEYTVAGTEAIDDPGGRAEPTRAERALTLALCLYAINQRSQYNEPMHIARLSKDKLDGLEPDELTRRKRAQSATASMGRAAARLRHDSNFNEDAVVRRFAALITAVDFDELAFHLRSMVTQFNGERIGQDYACLAADLYLLQSPFHADAVRLRWGRHFHQSPWRDRPDDDGARAAAASISSDQTGNVQ